MRKMADKKREKRTGRADRFLRMKHKTEELYKAPAFLRRNTGVSCVAASGIFETYGAFSKGYALEDVEEEKVIQLCERLQNGGNDYAIISGRFQKRMILVVLPDCADLTEAAERFAALEKEWSLLQGLSAELRLEYYCGFLSGMLGKKYYTGSYLHDTPAWKQAALLSEMKKEAAICTSAGAYAVVAIRRLPAERAREAVMTVERDIHMVASYAAISGIPDSTVTAQIGEYMGIEAMSSRIKRKAPQLYEAMQDRERRTEHGMPHFVRVNVYFLLQASDMEELKAITEDFLKAAREAGIQSEQIPFTQQKNPSELKRTIAMFGMTGSRQERYSTILTAEEGVRLAAAGNCASEEETDDYDIAKLKALFFEGKGEL